jgi:hypothetical protein
VATDRQTAANRRNARKSTGPRSGGGKKRASRNSYRHGLATALVTNEEHAKRVEKLARRIAGNSANFVILEHARSAAEAEFGLARVRQVKVALIQRMLAFGAFEAPPRFNSLAEVQQFLSQLGRGTIDLPAPVDAAATMPSAESERLAEAVRRALPELLKLERYERRAPCLRAQSLRAIYAIKNSSI